MVPWGDVIANRNKAPLRNLLLGASKNFVFATLRKNYRCWRSGNTSHFSSMLTTLSRIAPIKAATNPCT
jgi:hypothetical protein